MAIAYVQENFVSQNGPNGVAFNLTHAVAPGNHVIVVWGANSATSPGALSTNAPGAIAQTDAGAGTSNMICIGSIYAPNGIAVTDTLTVTAPGGVVRGIIVEEFSGLNTTSWADKSATNIGGSSVQTGTSGTTTATTQADELAVAGFTVNATLRTFTKDANYSYFTTGTGGFGSTSKESFAEYQILSAIGTQSASTTWSGSTLVYTGAIATYKAMPPPVSLPQDDRRRNRSTLLTM